MKTCNGKNYLIKNIAHEILHKSASMKDFGTANQKAAMECWRPIALCGWNLCYGGWILCYVDGSCAMVDGSCATVPKSLRVMCQSVFRTIILFVWDIFKKNGWPKCCRVKNSAQQAIRMYSKFCISCAANLAQRAIQPWLLPGIGKYVEPGILTRHSGSLNASQGIARIIQFVLGIPLKLFSP